MENRAVSGRPKTVKTISRHEECRLMPNGSSSIPIVTFLGHPVVVLRLCNLGNPPRFDTQRTDENSPTTVKVFPLLNAMCSSKVTSRANTMMVKITQ